METENHPPANILGNPLENPRTPERKQTINGPPVVNSTPMSNKYCAHAEDEVLQHASVLNKFLEDDVDDRVVFTLDEFATCILDLPPTWEVEEDFSLLPESEVVREAFEGYLKVAIGVADGPGKKRRCTATHERELYQPLVNLLNALRDGTGYSGKDVDEKIFYVQDPRPVLGSLLERKPDLGVIYVQLLKLTENKKLSDYLAEKNIVGVFWGLLLFFVEVKHEKTNYVGLKAIKGGTGTLENHSSKSVASEASQRGSIRGPKAKVAILQPTSSQSIPTQSKSTKRKSNDINGLSNVVNRQTKKVKSQASSNQKSSKTFEEGMKTRSRTLQAGSRSSSCVQSMTLPSTEGLSSRPNAPPPISTSTNTNNQVRPRVVVHSKGGKNKRLEVMTSQDYALRAEEELKAEKKLTPTQGQHRTRIQCASYAKEMLSNGFVRNHAMGITADDNGFRFQYYDRSKVVESQAFDIVDDEWKKFFMAMVCQLTKLSSEQLGFIPNLYLGDFDYLRAPEQFSYNFEDDPQGLVGATYRLDCSDGYSRIVVIKQVLYRAEGIIGRCSVVVEVECICMEPGCHWHGKRKVMKISFPSRSRPSEEVLIREARSKAESSGEHWALNHLPEIIDSITTTYHEKNTVQGRLKAHLKDKYEERVMRVTVLEKLHPLSELEDPREFAQVFYDILQIHQWLYECAGILHRDLSFGNIMFRRKQGKIYGVLNDFDLSSRVQDMDKGPSSNHRTGTRPFMSLDLLNPTWEGGHLYRHDLESLFYIMVCLACRYESPGIPADEPRAFSKWFSGTDDEVHDKKDFFLTNFRAVELPIQPYFASFKGWLDRIYQKMRVGYNQRPLDSVVVEEPSDDDEDEDPSFDWNTLNKHVSYRKMRSIMSSFAGGLLETRWATWNPGH